MNIFCIHISDLHLKAVDKTWCEKKVSILSSTISLEIKKEDCLIIIATGDLTNWGLVEEFVLLKSFLDNIKESFKILCDKVEIAIVPGNHDCYLNEPNDVRDSIVESIVEGKQLKDGLIRTCLEAQVLRDTLI